MASKELNIIIELLRFNPINPQFGWNSLGSLTVPELFFFFKPVLPKRARMWVLFFVFMFVCEWVSVCDPGTTCFGQLSHRKHSSVRRHRFLSSCARPLPTSLPAMAFSFSTSSDVCGCFGAQWFTKDRSENSLWGLRQCMIFKLARRNSP